MDGLGNSEPPGKHMDAECHDRLARAPWSVPLYRLLVLDGTRLPPWVRVCACESPKGVLFLMGEAPKGKPLVLLSFPEKDDPLATTTLPVAPSATLPSNSLGSAAAVAGGRARLHLGFPEYGYSAPPPLCQCHLPGREDTMVYVLLAQVTCITARPKTQFFLNSRMP